MEKEKRSMRYDEAFKREAVALVLDRRLPVAKAARQVEVNIDTLNKWIAAAEVRETEKYEQTFEECNMEPERENRALKMERDILKEAERMIDHPRVSSRNARNEVPFYERLSGKMAHDSNGQSSGCYTPGTLCMVEAQAVSRHTTA